MTNRFVKLTQHVGGGKILIVRRLCCWAVALCLFACGEYKVLDEEADSSEAVSSVRIQPRAADSEALSYPLYIYAFGADDGKLLARQQLSAADEELRLSLPRSVSCRVVAVSADAERYEVPADPVASSVIRLKSPDLPAGASDFAKSIAQGFSLSSPVQMGSADIVPTGDKATLTIQMNYRMAAFSVTLAGLPAVCTAAYVSVAGVAQGVTFDGTPGESVTARIPFDPQTWSTGEVYLFPAAVTQTTFTIAYNDADGEQYASVHYLSPLAAGTPYQLNGTCTDGAWQLTGSVTPPVWSDSVRLDFGFTAGETTTLQPGTSGGSGAYTVAALPEPLTEWNGHLVAAVLDKREDNASATLLLMSLTDYAGLTSAANTETPTTAFSLAAHYSEADLSAWRIPSADEALLLRKAYIDQPDRLETLIDDLQADAVVLTDEKGNNLRYLCADASKTFSFKSGSSYNSIKEAGATVKSYRLRLVTTVQVRVDPELQEE